MISTRQPRSAFTITELLVAMALILFIMAILSEAFVMGLESMRHLKAVGDMDAKLRGTITMICHDLEADHFDNNKGLSDQMVPPTQGFFRLFQGSAPIVEGTDADGIPSTRSADSMLHFTIKLSGLRLENFFNLSFPGAPANARSQWAEVAYFLRPTGTTSGASPDALPLFSLHRRQRVLYIPGPGQLNLNLLGNQLPISMAPQLFDVSTSPDLLNPLVVHFNSPSDLTIPVNRLGMLPSPNLLDPLQLANAGILANNKYPAIIDSPTLQSYWGIDLALTDVISFEVKISTGGDFMDLFDPALQSLIKNPAFQGPGTPKVFDTWTSARSLLVDYSNWLLPGTTLSKPLDVQVKAIQISIRIWDPKTLKTRQVTFMQSM